MLHDILDNDHIQWHPPLIRHYTNFWPLLIWTLLPNMTFYLFVQGLNRTYATGATCQQRTLSPPDTGPFPLWDFHVFLCRDQSLLNLSCFRTFEFRTSLGTSFLLSTQKRRSISQSPLATPGQCHSLTSFLYIVAWTGGVFQVLGWKVIHAG